MTFATLDPKLLPDGSSIFHLLRNFGSSIFISLSFMTVVRTAKINYSDLVQHVTPLNERLDYGFVTGSWTIDSLRGLMALGGEVQRQSQMIGYDNAFVLYAIVCFATLPLLAFVQIKRRD